MNDAAALIELDALEKRFPGQDKPALASLTAQIRSGAVTGLVGPDGAGKTTLMRMLAGLLTPSHGAIKVIDWIPSNKIASCMPSSAICRRNLGCTKTLP
ncbi:ABC transporter family protein [Brenneria salicis ATCC 15712 = DSM 30166]|uniref:ABC transporter family protein n=1 Tax=Brenneria salicis ATCC 15712 = DSM 30166 TaxID=714314 RepID=A0A366I3T0_9GAMM|nr:ABC transporter family protein [Brenneria salicis ATCC 15712 = DSM 30166]